MRPPSLKATIENGLLIVALLGLAAVAILSDILSQPKPKTIQSDPGVSVLVVPTPPANPMPPSTIPDAKRYLLSHRM